MKVGYLGPKGTFSYEVCKNYCVNNEKIIECKTIPDTILALEKEEIDECVVPIENSLQGCVTDTLDCLIQNDSIFVKKEILVDINQNLMSNVNCSLDNIEIVYSHPQALAQCKNFLEKNMPNAKIIPLESTAYAAKKVSEETSNVACIGNISCLEEYNLTLLKENIQDNFSNKTKFWVLVKNYTENINSKKMSMIFSVKDKPGALFNVLKIFNEHNLNLTKIESRPAKTVIGEYFFLIDVEIKSLTDADLALKDIESNGVYYRILGKY